MGWILQTLLKPMANWRCEIKMLKKRTTSSPEVTSTIEVKK